METKRDLNTRLSLLLPGAIMISGMVTHLPIYTGYQGLSVFLVWIQLKPVRLATRAESLSPAWGESHCLECWSSLLPEHWLHWTLTLSQDYWWCFSMVGVFSFCIIAVLVCLSDWLWGNLWGRQMALSWWSKPKGQVGNPDLKVVSPKELIVLFKLNSKP